MASRHGERPTGPTETVKPVYAASYEGKSAKDVLADGDPLEPLQPKQREALEKLGYTKEQLDAENSSREKQFYEKASGQNMAQRQAEFDARRKETADAAAKAVEDSRQEQLNQAKQVETNRGTVLFSEQKLGPHPAYYVAARVFISGVEVTNYLTGTLSITYAGRDGHNTASFTLQCAEDNFIITEANSPGLEVLKKEYSKTVKWETEVVGSGVKTTGSTTTTQTVAEVQPKGKGRWRTAPDVPLYSEHAKKGIFEYKNGHPFNQILSLDGQQQGESAPLKAGESPSGKFSGSRMWPLQADRPVFHKNDPVRIFIHNPLYHPKDVGDEQWLPAFAGFIDSYPWTEDYLTGHKDIQISCYDLRALMRYMRVINVLPQSPAANPNLPAGKELSLLRQYFGQEAGSMFLLMELGTMTKNVFAGLKFEHAISALTVGDKSVFPAGGALGSQAKLTPVGPAFVMGQIMYYGGTNDNIEKVGQWSHSTSATDLDAWHTLCLAGPKDLSRYGVTGKRPDPFLTSRQVEQLGKNTVWWDNSKPNPQPGKACPANQQLHLLLPGGGTIFNTLYSYEQAGSQMESVDLDYTDRFTLINELCNLLDYHWMVTPFGDLVFEFPMYDFFPSPGDRRPGSTRSTKAGAAPSSNVPSDKKHMGFKRWSGAFTLDWHLTSASYNDESSGEITTILFADGPLNLYGEASPTGSFINRSMLFVPTLLRRLGAVTATQNFTFTITKAAICRAGLLELRRRLGRIATLEAQTIYRPFLLPNRPLYVAPRRRCGNIASVTHTLELNANAGTSVSLQYIRHRDQFGNWTHVTGAENMPLDFTLMSDYANFKDFAKNSWIVDGICAPCLDESGQIPAPGGGGSGGGGGSRGYRDASGTVKSGSGPSMDKQEIANLINCLKAKPSLRAAGGGPYARKSGLNEQQAPTSAMMAIGGVESGGYFTAVNPGSGATGLWQYTGTGWKGSGWSPNDRADPIKSTDYKLDTFASDWARAGRIAGKDENEQMFWAYMAHNMGPGALDHAKGSTFEERKQNLSNWWDSTYTNQNPDKYTAASGRIAAGERAAKDYTNRLKGDTSFVQPGNCDTALNPDTYTQKMKDYEAKQAPPSSQPAPSSQPTT